MDWTYTLISKCTNPSTQSPNKPQMLQPFTSPQSDFPGPVAVHIPPSSMPARP